MRRATHRLATAVLGAGFLFLSSQPSSLAKGTCGSSACTGANIRSQLVDVRRSRDEIQRTLSGAKDPNVWVGRDMHAYYKERLPTLIKHVGSFAPKLAKQMAQSFKAAKKIEKQPGPAGQLSHELTITTSDLFPEKMALKEYGKILSRAVKHLDFKEKEMVKLEKREMPRAALGLRGKISDIRRSRAEIERKLAGAEEQHWDHSVNAYYKRMLPMVIRRVSFTSPKLAKEMWQSYETALKISREGESEPPFLGAPDDSDARAVAEYDQSLRRALDHLAIKQEGLEKELAELDPPKPPEPVFKGKDVQTTFATVKEQPKPVARLMTDPQRKQVSFASMKQPARTLKMSGALVPEHPQPKLPSKAAHLTFVPRNKQQKEQAAEKSVEPRLTFVPRQ